MSTHTSAGAPASRTAHLGMLPFINALKPFPSWIINQAVASADQLQHQNELLMYLDIEVNFCK